MLLNESERRGLCHGRLNARKPIRDEQQNARDRSIEVPTIPTLG